MSTPLRRQYLEIKRRYPGMILLYQIGDFYEAFDEDAQTIARELGIVLTRKWFGKGNAHPLAGVPVRSLESHLAKLINRGYKVAVCDQVTPPGKGLVEREVVRIITPGTVIEPGLLERRANNYLASLVADERSAGLSYADVTTGEFRMTQLERAEAVAELERVAPAELLVPGDYELPPIEVRAITRLESQLVELDEARRALMDHFEVAALEAYGADSQPLATRAAGAIIAYLRDTQPDALSNLTHLQSYRATAFMQIDPQTMRNLEIFQGWDFTGGAPTGSLVATIDLTATPMGGRLLRRWLRHPLLEVGEIRARQDCVEWFYKHEQTRERARTMLEEVLDVERLLGRIRRRLAVPYEVISLAHSLKHVGQIRSSLDAARAPAGFIEPLEPTDDLIEFIERAISDRPPSDFERGGIIRTGFSKELDDLRATLGGGRSFLADFEKRERERTGIRSLKVGYNKVFGYYIEVTKPNLRLVPNDYVRKQTLTNAERFFTLELKEHESLIANARERILELETNLYRQICDQISRHHERISRVGAGLGRVDLYAALAELAARFGYARPEITEDDEIIIVKGRHPMIEQMIERRKFIPNDARLSNRGLQIMLLTAPNMAGKSVYLRQVALTCLLAQIGSFVPAESAKVGIVDRIFTRIGLNDYTLRGHSSFMIEMIETAHILHHATPKSLVLLDEIGRGTSTADGLSIARAVIEYLHNQPKIAAKTLFATHYHELTGCSDYLPRVRNFHLAVRERHGKVQYLHRVEEGRAEKSFGIYVAQLAGLPKPVLRRANELLNEHDGATAKPEPREGEGNADARGREVRAFLESLMALDVNELSPVEALTKLYELQRRAKDL
ncbi:MAG TPA: DNA mismatch repair protein MutS [Blastocatellia bacterium]|jgi:DNA mismatch repair protein MutS|nr:DNA mismatch repair protein MutS [Blastocatellia bacterium]